MGSMVKYSAVRNYKNTKNTKEFIMEKMNSSTMYRDNYERV